MRKIGILFLAFLLIIFFAVLYRLRVDSENENVKSKIQETVDISVSLPQSYLFIPYWTIDSDISFAPFDVLIYFGVEGGRNGISLNDEGYQKLDQFTEYADGKNTLLTVRMLNSEENSDILKSSHAQKDIIHDAILIAKENGFKGIVLDLEMKGLPFDTLVNRITEFNREFSKEAKKNNLTFGTLAYGDVYYRIRPYDMKELSRVVDRIFVMSYDFSKSGGSPGPNFPLEGSSTYGYDFKTMVSDFKKEVPISKLTFVFGMFGYSWPIDKNGKSIDSGTAKTTLQFERMIARCVTEKSCEVDLDPMSSETVVTYEENSQKYISWFETSYSSEKKILYLKAQGIHSIGWWAYSYF